VITAAFVAISVIAALLVVHLRGRGKRDSTEESAGPSNREKFDTTLGEFHDMREALRPLQHTRATSRRDPRNAK
jgi:hypothetical protein